jgi:nitrile hydratase accessory protein
MQPERPFDAPWQAQAFALAIALHDKGLFTWPEWAEKFSAARRAGDEAPDAYWRHWVETLEGFAAGARV